MWVSCETFAQIVAGFFDDANIKPMQQNRVLFKAKKEADVKPMMKQIKALFEAKTVKFQKDLFCDDDDRSQQNKVVSYIVHGNTK